MDGNTHPHEWARATHDWWDSKYGPDGQYRNTGPLDDERRRVLVLNSGLTRAQYVAWDPAVMAPFISEASRVGPHDVWVDLDPPPHRHPGETLRLCKQDTLPAERDELDARGFTYLGSRDDLMYFVNPYGDIDMSTHTDTYYDEPRVRIIIHRDACMCSSYHKKDAPSNAWDWSRVSFDGVPPRTPPVQPPETADARLLREEQQRKRARDNEELRLQASHGNPRAGFLVALLDMQRSVREAADAEMRK